MPVPEYGAAPLAKTFVLVRGLSLICMIAIVGMTANFVAEIIGSSVEPPKEIVGTLVVVRGSLSLPLPLPLAYTQTISLQLITTDLPNSRHA